MSDDALLAAAHEAIANRGLRERVAVEHRLAHLVRRASAIQDLEAI